MSKRERKQSGAQEQAIIRAMAALGSDTGMHMAAAFKEGWLWKRAQVRVRTVMSHSLCCIGAGWHTHARTVPNSDQAHARCSPLFTV
jgi:hypothetical protein